MRPTNRIFTTILSLSFVLQPQAWGGSNKYSMALNDHLRTQISQSMRAPASLRFDEYLASASVILNDHQQKELKKSLGALLQKQMPEVAISASPWVRYLIKDEKRWHTLSFVGTESSFMTLNGENITWQQARNMKALSERIDQILNSDKGYSTHFSLLSLLFPRAYAESWANRNSPLIWGGALILAASVFGIFASRSVKALANANTTHTVVVDGIPDEVKTEHDININGIPDEITTNNTIDLNTTHDFNTSHDFNLNLNSHLIRLTGSALPKESSSSSSSSEVHNVRSSIGVD